MELETGWREKEEGCLIRWCLGKTEHGLALMNEPALLGGIAIGWPMSLQNTVFVVLIVAENMNVPACFQH